MVSPSTGSAQRHKLAHLCTTVLATLLLGTAAVAAEMQVVNVGSTPLPAGLMVGEVVLDAPLAPHATMKCVTPAKPAPASWVRQTNGRHIAQDGQTLVNALADRITLLDALALFTDQGVQENNSARPWEVEVRGQQGMRLRFIGPRDGEIVAGSRLATFDTLQPVTLMPRKEFNVPRYARAKDVIADANDWLYLGRRNGNVPEGDGLYLWCKQGKVEFSGTQLLLQPGTVLGFCRAPYTPNWYVPAEPVVLSAQGNGLFDGKRGSLQLSVLDRNGNGLADLQADLWWVRPADGKSPGLLYAFQPAASGQAEFLCLAKPPAGMKALQNVAVQARIPVDPKEFTQIELRDQSFVVGAASATTKALVTFWDWHAAGRFFCGDLLAGGHMTEGWSTTNDTHSGVVLDLDANGIADVFFEYATKSAPDGLGGSHAHYNFSGRIGGLRRFTIDTSAGKVNYLSMMGGGVPGGPRMLMDISSQYSKTMQFGRYFKGAAQGFEEHFHYRLDQQDETGGAFATSPNALFFFKTTNGNIDRMTMGRFGGGPSVGWNIELDPLETVNDQPPAFRVCEFRDPQGRTVKVTSSILPERWDGKPLTLKRQANGGVDILPDAPWKHVSTGKYFNLQGVHASFSQEGNYYVCNEGMYGGYLSYAERIERNRRGVDFTLYYSPIFGGLHLRNADVGYTAFPPDFHGSDRFNQHRWYRKDGLELKENFIGTLDIYCMPEGKRYLGPEWLYYQDLDGDGYFDAYLYDEDNDGLYDRSAWYTAASGSVLYCQGDRFAAWPEKFQFTDVPYQMESYDRMEQLWLKGLGEDPLPARVTLSSSGLPIEYRRGAQRTPARDTLPPRNLCVSAGQEWSARVAVDTYHGDPTQGTWQDYGPDGLVRLATLFQQHRVLPATLAQPWSDATLAPLDVLILTRLTRLPTNDEMVALFRWIHAGGTLLLSPQVDDETRVWFAYFGERMAFALQPARIENRTSIRRYPSLGAFEAGYIAQERIPAPGNRLEHYQTEIPGLLDDLTYACFTGYSLQLTGKMTPLLRYKDQPVIAWMPLGKGRIVINGTDLLVNRYVVHPAYLEPRMDNDELVNRLVRWLAESVAAFDVQWQETTAECTSFTVAGKGGTLTVRRLADNQRLLVNGQPVTTVPQGIVEQFTLPAGTHTVSIETVK
jgi:hypothetical protein